MTTIPLNSPSFGAGEPIPAKHTCDGSNLSPALQWDHLPKNAKSLALICDDPDAPGGTWVHWVLYNLPASLTELPEGVPNTHLLPTGAEQGLNDFGAVGYGGPCPPPGAPHRYFFKLYALDSEVHPRSGATKKDLLSAMERHVLAEGQLMGTYKRR